MEVEFTCMVCEAQHRRSDHHCPVAPSCCELGKHTDICRRCRKLILQNFEEQVKPKELPAPKQRDQARNE